MAKDLQKASVLIKTCLTDQIPYLDLSNCGISDLNDLPDLFKCIHLETLILSSYWWSFDDHPRDEKLIYSENENNISALSPKIVNLKKLTKLIACGSFDKTWKINDINLLGQLNEIEYLDLSSNEIADYSFLSQMKSLKYLYIGSNKIENIDFFENLKQLKALDLYLNNISSINALKNLEKLEHLDLRDNMIFDIEALSDLKNLRTLYIRAKTFSSLGFLTNLRNLKVLGLNSTTISNFDVIERLKRIEYLDLSDNPIVDFTFLTKLQNLKSLFIRSTRFSNLSFLTNLKSLQQLDLSYNEISDIYYLSTLIDLKHLDISNNEIYELEPLKGLTRLETLDISNNRIVKIPLFIFQLKMEIFTEKEFKNGLLLEGNAVESPPLEIIKQGRRSILNWFEATKARLNEIKVILIGDPKAGKTSILRMLKDNIFDENEVQTDGINIEHLNFGLCDTFKNQKSLHNLIGHFWDFGGQEIMNATHQFFLTSRSVYILVLDARNDTNISTQIRQWIKRILATGGNSPIIVVANQIDVNPGFGFSNEYELQNEFPQIKYFIKTSCKTGKDFNLIKEILEELVPKAELFNTEVDERWIKIKELLQEETKSNHFLDETRFIEICSEYDLQGKNDRKNVINFLHDLGLVLHFEDLNLSEYYVLDPYWITYGVYQILTSNHAGENKGLVSMDKLEFIINEEEDKNEIYQPVNYKKIQYTPNQRRFLVDILNQFKLSFYLPNRKYFIIPDLLDTNEPINVTETLRKADSAIKFIYEYQYLPKSAMPYLMVETHQLIEEMWRTGCVLNYNDCKALISNYQNRILITVIGEYKKKREFMAIIRHLVDKISHNLSDMPKLLIPLPDIEAYVDYEELQEREKDGEKYFTLYKPKKEKYEISILLEGIPTIDEVGEISRKLDIILANQEELKTKLEYHYQYLIQIPENNRIIDDLINSIKEMNADQCQMVTDEIMQFIAKTLNIFSEEVDDKLKALYTDLKKSDNIEMKLKLGVPFINLLGIELETKFDVKKWAINLYNKYDLKIFKLVGII